MIPRTVLTVAVAAALVAGCGSDDDSSSTTAAAPTAATSVESTPPTEATPTSTSTAASSPATSGNTVAATLAPATDGPEEVLITVTVGVDSSPERIERVPLGSTVTLEMTDPNADQEFHVHDYDLGGNTEVPAGETARFTFVADRPGSFEVESHVTDEVLVTLEVS